jgi:hypothetical protein
MRRLCLVSFGIFVFVALLGCTTEAKRQWAEAMKDARGENMEMGSHSLPKIP